MYEDNDTEIPVVETPIKSAPVYDVTAKEMVSGSSQQMFDHFINRNFSEEQKQELAQQLAAANVENNGNFTVSWRGSDDQKDDYVEATFRDGKLQKFEMHNQDKFEELQAEQHIKYKEKKHTVSVKSTEVIEDESGKTKYKTTIKAADDNAFKAQTQNSHSQSETVLNVKEQNHHSTLNRSAFHAEGESNGTLSTRNSGLVQEIQLGKTNELNRLREANERVVDGDGNVLKTKTSITQLNLGKENQWQNNRHIERNAYDDDGDVVQTKVADRTTTLNEKGLTEKRQTLTTNFDEEGRVDQTKVTNTDMSVGEHGLAHQRHIVTNNMDDDGVITDTKVTDNKLSINKKGVTENFTAETTQFDEDGSQHIKSHTTGVSFDGTTATVSHGRGRREIDAEGTETYAHDTTVALSGGRVYGAHVDINHKTEDGETHLSTGAKFGVGAIGADLAYERQNEDGHVKVQMVADADAAKKCANATVQSLREQQTEEGLRTRSLNAGLNLDTDNVSLTYNQSAVDENGSRNRNFNTGASLADGKLTAKLGVSRQLNDAEGNALVNKDTQFSFEGNKKGLDVSAQSRDGQHVVSNEAHAHINGLPEANVTHTVTDNGTVTAQNTVGTDQVYGALGEMAQKTVNSVADTSENLRTTVATVEKSVTETPEKVKNIPTALLRSMKIKEI
ncbi:MAG: hypothetical protein J6Y91_01965 [Alphaproteobacteria bacterium]|nr:hypothetical protein [Alphaproteobacteria bacterium]